MVLLFHVVSAVGQSPNPPGDRKFSVGFRAGPSVTWARFRDPDLREEFESVPKPGFTAAGLIIFPLKGRYSFMTEFGYSMKGKSLLFNQVNEAAWRNRATYQFLEGSMALRKGFKFTLGKSIPSDWYFNIGPNIEYWLTGTGQIATRGDSSAGFGTPSKYKVAFNQQPTGDFMVNYMVNSNKWLFGLDVGIGADAHITNSQRIHTELRLTWGHTYYGKPDSQSYLAILGFKDDLHANMKTLTLSAAYTFDFDLIKGRMGKSTSTLDKGRRKKK